MSLSIILGLILLLLSATIALIYIVGLSVILINDSTSKKYQVDLIPDTSRIPQGLKYDYFKIQLVENYNEIKKIKHFKNTRFKEIKPILLKHKSYTATSEEEADMLRALGLNSRSYPDGWTFFL